MATTKFTDLITLTQAAWFDDADKAAYAGLTGVSGTNTIAATGPASLGAYAVNNRFHFIPANTNTGATTINITQSGASALGAKNIFKNGAACVGGEIVVGVPVEIIYDGTQFQIIGLASLKVVNTTFDCSTASGTFSITGVGFRPRFVEMMLGFSAGSASGCESIGWSDGLAEATNSNLLTAGAGQRALTFSLGLANQGAGSQTFSVVSFNADGATFANVKDGTPGSTVNVSFKFYR